MAAPEPLHGLASRQDAQEALAGDLAEMAGQLASALALEDDAALRSWLRAEAGARPGEPLSIRLGPQEVWAVLKGPQTRLVRAAEPASHRVDLHQRLWQDKAALARFETAQARTSAHRRAEEMLRPLLQRGQDPTRRLMASLQQRSALLEHTAYRFSTRCIHVLQDLRRDLLVLGTGDEAGARASLLTYWRLVLASGHLSVLAASPDARPWLVDMAGSFTWVDWTPSMPLVLERSLWFAAVGAKQAAAFGEAVVERYVRAMALAGQPLRVFDAALGLLAIGLDDPRLVPALQKELDLQAQRFERASSTHSALLAGFARNAGACIAVPEAAERALPTELAGVLPGRGAEVGLFSRAALQLDAAEPLAHGYLGLLALPALMRIDLEALYPAHPPRQPVSGMGPSAIATHIRRTWTPSQKPTAKPH
jgi:hypothetical protein